mgnify:CR=1 FL=1|tara:strand:- start:4015 stop:4974 length:960 start_codon:yes stop_codon:yes gene_type:complete
MNKEVRKKLTANFPKEVVRPAPKGKFGKYVPHHLYTQRLVDVIPGGYDFSYDVIRDKDNAIVGARCILYLKEDNQTIIEVGDVDVHQIARNITESEILKLAVSDGIKRCCMRIGLGLELWTGETTEEEHYTEVSSTPVKKLQVAQKTGTSPSDDADDLQNIILDLCNKDKTLANKVWKFALNSMQIKKGVPEKIKDYDEDHEKQFVEIAAQFLKKNKEEFAKREGEPEYMNVVRENFDDVEIKEDEVGERPPSGPWEQDPPSEAQLKPFNEAMKRTADIDVDLYEKAKKALNDGTITKGNIYDWINREDSPWVLQDGSK